MLNLINYSPKSIAITGDYQEIESQLIVIGGKFNSRLSCGPGWIFAKKYQFVLQDIVNQHNQSVDSSTANYVEAVLEHNYMRKSY